MNSNATAAAAAKIVKPKKTNSTQKPVSQTKQEQNALPLPVPALPEFGLMNIEAIIVIDQVRKEFDEADLNELAMDIAHRRYCSQHPDGWTLESNRLTWRQNTFDVKHQYNFRTANISRIRPRPGRQKEEA